MTLHNGLGAKTGTPTKVIWLVDMLIVAVPANGQFGDTVKWTTR